MENVEAIVYINLDKRKDRLEHMCMELEKIPGLDPKKIHRFAAIEDGLVGCLKSHLAVVQMAVEKKWTNVLIFEDDFTWEEGDLEHSFARMAEFWKHHQADFGFIQLAHIGLKESSEIEDEPGLYRVFSATNAAGYWVHERAYAALIRVYEAACEPLAATHAHWLYSNDIVWDKVRSALPTYAFFPRLGYQCAGYSDLGLSFLPAR